MVPPVPLEPLSCNRFQKLTEGVKLVGDDGSGTAQPDAGLHDRIRDRRYRPVREPQEARRVGGAKAERLCDRVAIANTTLRTVGLREWRASHAPPGGRVNLGLGSRSRGDQATCVWLSNWAHSRTCPRSWSSISLR